MRKSKRIKKKSKPLDKKFYIIIITISILVGAVLLLYIFGICYFSFKCPVIVLILAVPIIIACDHSGIRAFIFHHKFENMFDRLCSRKAKKKAAKRIRNIPSELVKTFVLIFTGIYMTFPGTQLFVAPAIIGLSAFSLYRFFAIAKINLYKPYYITSEYANTQIGESVTINVHKGLLGLKSYELVEDQ